MSRQFEKEIMLFNGKAFGYTVSKYGMENGYLDYLTLSKVVGDMVLNNAVFEYAGYENWQLESGLEEDEDGNYLEVYQWYIIGYHGAKILEEYTDELVYYHEDLGMYLWGVTHFGTAWDYVLTDVKLKGE